MEGLIHPKQLDKIGLVNRGHRLLEQIERKIQKVLAHVIVFTHLEPLDDPASWQDEALDGQIHSDEGSGHHEDDEQNH